MKKESLDKVLSLLEGVPCDEYALMHEAAVTVWGLNYSVIPHSPEWRFLLEQRARLAEVLYFDDMTDEELATFHRYVRGN